MSHLPFRVLSMQAEGHCNTLLGTFSSSGPGSRWHKIHPLSLAYMLASLILFFNEPKAHGKVLPVLQPNIL